MRDTLPSLDAGRPVLSSVRLLVPATAATIGGDRLHPGCVPWTDPRQFVHWAMGDVLADEVTGLFPAGESAPPQVRDKAQQLRRVDAAMRWTAPAYQRAVLWLREPTQSVTLCRGFVKTTITDDAGNERLWKSRSLFQWRTYDAALVDEFHSGQIASQAGKARNKRRWRPVAREWFWRPRSREESAYRTLDPVTQASAGAAGWCHVCLHKVRAVYCDGHDRAEVTQLDLPPSDVADLVDVGDRVEPIPTPRARPARRRAATRPPTPDLDGLGSRPAGKGRRTTSSTDLAAAALSDRRRQRTSEVE